MAPLLSRNDRLLFAALGVAALVWYFVLRDGGQSSPSQEPVPEPSLGPYEQTWTTPYGETTCTQWHESMDAHERFVAAGDMLTASWDNGQIPDDALINTFARAIGTACGSEAQDLDLNVAEVAATLYVMSDELHPP